MLVFSYKVTVSEISDKINLRMNRYNGFGASC